MIGLSAAITFFLLDLFAPSVGSGARTGAGFGIGAQIVGFPAAGVAGAAPAAISGLQFGGDLSSTGENPAPVAPSTGIDSLGAPAGCAMPMAPPTATITSCNGPNCRNSSPLFNPDPNLKEGIRGCDCTLNCNGCGPELQCPVTCKTGPIVFPDCRIESNNSPYKIIPGQYSHQVILPGYNECVRPYNYYRTNP
jgi:hypothetical protein